MTKRFYIGKKDFDEYAEYLEEWLADKIPYPPPGTVCECNKDQHAHESEPDANNEVTIVDCVEAATSYLYYIKGDHVCYTWVCEPCMEARCSDSYLADIEEFPTTKSGYAVAPRHCA